MRDALKAEAKVLPISDLQLGGGVPQPRMAIAIQPAVEPGTSPVQVTVSATIELQ